MTDDEFDGVLAHFSSRDATSADRPGGGCYADEAAREFVFRPRSEVSDDGKPPFRDVAMIYPCPTLDSHRFRPSAAE